MTFITHVPIDDLEFIVIAKAICNIATIKLRVEMREKRREVYDVSVYFDHGSCAPHGIAVVSFSCANQNRQALIQIVHNVLKDLITSEMSQADLNPVKETMKKDHELKLKNNSYWLFWLLDTLKVKEMLAAANCESSAHDESSLESNLYRRHLGMFGIINSLTPKQIQSAARSMLDLDRYRVHVLAPVVKLGPLESGEEADDGCSNHRKPCPIHAWQFHQKETATVKSMFP